MKSQKKISDAFTIRGHVIKNRICVPPMHVGRNADERGMATGRAVEHYRAFAAGGAGLIIQEATCILPDGLLAPIQIGCWSNEQIPGLARIADAVHKENGVIVAQIHHAGATGVCEEVVSSSEYTVKESGKTARALTTEEVRDMINAFVAAAVRIYKAGYDGVELHGCHSYLISQFFNRRVNKRSDIYADSMEFVEPILRKIREQVSEDFIIGIRLGAFEPTLEDGIAHAKELDAAGIDFIDVSYGFRDEADSCSPQSWEKYADIVWAAGEIKKQVSVPVFAVNGICTGQEAAEVLELTEVDMIDVGRSSMVDPDWTRKVLAGEVPGKCFHCKRCNGGKPEKCAGALVLKREKRTSSLTP